MEDILDLHNLSQKPETNCLVGKLFSCKYTDSNALFDHLGKSWKIRKGIEAREWAWGLFLFRFEDAADMSWVIDNQPWLYNGFIFLIRPLAERERPSTIDIHTAQFWAQIYDAPVEYTNIEVARSVGSRIGRLICVDSENLDPFGKFMRVKVEVDVYAPLRGMIQVRIGGENVWLHVKYESLPLHCFECRKIGHTAKRCRGGYDDEQCELRLSRFGPNIRASPTREESDERSHSKGSSESHCYSKQG